MEIDLFYFKNYVNFSISFDKGTTLIKGDSGVGKSNIFEALTWALYGSIREIDPWSNPSAKTKVAVRYKNIEIIRGRRPTSFTVTTPEGVFEDPQAQDIVEKYFGSKIIWECTGYVDEDLSNTLFSLTSKQRLNVLSTLSFPGNNPEDKIEEINTAITNQRYKYELARDMYNSIDLEYGEWWKNNGEDVQVIEAGGPPSYSVKELQKSLKDMNNQLISLKSEEATQKVLIERLDDINLQLEKIEEVLARSIDVEGLQRKLELAIERENLERHPCMSANVIVYLYSEQDYTDTLEQERDYNRFQEVLRRYRLTSDNVSEEISKLRNIVSKANTNFYPLVKRKEELNKQLPSVSLSLPTEHFVWDEVLLAREYESIRKHNSSLQSRISRYKLDFSIEKMEEIIRNERSYILIRKKKELKKQLDDLGMVEAPEHLFSHSDLYQTREIEKKRKLIRDGVLGKDHFDHMRDIEVATRVYQVYGQGIDKSLIFTPEDLANAKKLEEYKAKYEVVDFKELRCTIDKVRLYKKYCNHIVLQSIYSVDVLTVAPVDEAELDKVTREYREIEHDLEPLTCPHCLNNVYYYESDHKLEKASKIYSAAEKDRIKIRYMVYTSRKKITRERDDIIKIYGPFPSSEELKLYSSYEPLYRKYSDYTDDLVNMETSSQEIARHIHFQEAYGKLSEHGKKYYDQVETDPQLIDKIRRVGEYVSDPVHPSEYIRRCIEQLSLFQKYQNLKREYDLLEVEDVEEYTGDISKVKECLSLHRQLKCEVNEPIASSVYMENCIKQEEEYRKYIQVKAEYDSIVIPDQLIISPEELSRTRIILQDLESIRVTDKPAYSSDYILTSITKTELLTKLANYPTSDRSDVIALELKRNKEIQRQQDGMRVMKDKLISEKEMIVINTTISQKIIELTDNISIYEDEINATILYDEYLSRKSKRDGCYSDVQLWISKLSKTEELHRIATDTMYQILSASISDINQSIEKIVSVIFNDPVEIKLKMFKQLKTKSIVKPEVSLEVRYRGAVLNSIKRLSKGERSRIVLAVTLALNKVSNLPILCLDETLAHIDQNMKENVTAVLKEYATHRPLAIIAHDVITGLYDNLIEL